MYVCMYAYVNILLRIEKFIKYRDYNKIQNIRVRTKYKR